MIGRVLVPLALAIAATLVAFGSWEASSPPRVRYARLTLRDWPSGEPPLHIAIASDVHVAGPDMTPGRLRGIVAGINRLHPDLVLLAGDFVSDKKLASIKYPADQAIGPLAGLRAPLGVVAVLGNHDHWRGASGVRKALAAAGVIVLANQAVAKGPLAIGGVDDDFSGNSDLDRTIVALRRTRGARVLLSHTPDLFPRMPGDVGLMVAGHTHCGQIVLPLIGALASASRYGNRYRCGLIHEAGRTLIVSAGLGTSILPFRFGAPPDLWLIEVGGAGTSARSAG